MNLTRGFMLIHSSGVYTITSAYVYKDMGEYNLMVIGHNELKRTILSGSKEMLDDILGYITNEIKTIMEYNSTNTIDIREIEKKYVV